LKNEREKLYTIRWTQVYPDLQEKIDELMDDMLESSEYAEAKQVIAKIKNNINGYE
jgi:hypothetical protein